MQEASDGLVVELGSEGEREELARRVKKEKPSVLPLPLKTSSLDTEAGEEISL